MKGFAVYNLLSEWQILPIDDREYSIMNDFKTLLDESVLKHGHLCAGQVIGVRMAMLGCTLVGIDDPKDPKYRKKLIVYVEIDRCATDAIASVSGCQLGRRTLKFKDFGINAATFVNLDTRLAYRLISTESSRDYACKYASPKLSSREQQIVGYQNMPDSLLFDVQQVEVDLPETDMPGPPRRHMVCERCGQMIRDGKEIQLQEEIICRPCSEESYFKVIVPLSGACKTQDTLNTMMEENIS
jgi:formylmethanofuran dehydrogenase subunit E